MPNYLLSVCYPADAVQPPPEELAAIMTRVGALSAEMQKAGVWVFGGGLHDPSSATVVREHDGDVSLTDGPFIESKEQIGGLTIIDVEDLDQALARGREEGGGDRRADRGATVPGMRPARAGERPGSGG